MARFGIHTTAKAYPRLCVTAAREWSTRNSCSRGRDSLTPPRTCLRSCWRRVSLESDRRCSPLSRSALMSHPQGRRWGGSVPRTWPPSRCRRGGRRWLRSLGIRQARVRGCSTHSTSLSGEVCADCNPSRGRIHLLLNRTLAERRRRIQSSSLLTGRSLPSTTSIDAYFLSQQ